MAKKGTFPANAMRRGEIYWVDIPNAIGFTKPGGKTPVIKTSPRWCPLREGNGGHVRESFKGVSD